MTGRRQNSPQNANQFCGYWYHWSRHTWDPNCCIWNKALSLHKDLLIPCVLFLFVDVELVLLNQEWDCQHLLLWLTVNMDWEKQTNDWTDLKSWVTAARIQTASLSALTLMQIPLRKKVMQVSKGKSLESLKASQKHGKLPSTVMEFLS